MQKVSSQSTNTGLAPSSVIAPTVATKVLAVVITSSFGLMVELLQLLIQNFIKNSIY